ncbi:MAG: DUF6882 domain-containing protein [Candidatus Thiodiazotropha endolucinida]|uniref:Uncharacterized protein n=1 Tax=Candidatus Thiodiazotropha endolucinida TaxID=1655433 RepID=A0A7Z0VHU4_9GAMM|nr:DUF6882 domain-containing protein [Candidatus Thiodiazotropha endolucinida]ODJ85760.1 hypothetical protein CODIS_39970 [Candidatus Thiodiazotropha endolucinida]
MNGEEFDKYLEDACDELDQKYQVLVDEFGFGSHDNFVVEYENQSLIFFDKEKPVVEASILPVASHIPEKESLVWFWSNRNLPDAVRDHSAAVKKLYEVTGYEVFDNPSVECDETMAWEIAAMACKCLGAIGVYRIPQANMHSYVLITEVRHYG